MKHIFTFIALGLLTLANAQSPCGTNAPSEEWEQQFQIKIAEYKEKLATSRIQQTNYVIPVIVHILHDGDDVGVNENIPLEQVRRQIEILNDDFRGEGYKHQLYSQITKPSDWPNISNTGITFCLAKQTPNGTPLTEEGVERININNKPGWLNPRNIYSSDFLKSHFNEIIKKDSYWDPSRYLNIWIAYFPNAISSIDGNDTSYLNGFAKFPTGSNLTGLNEEIEIEKTSGVVIRTDMFGDNTFFFSQSYNYGRTATHEIGHYLGLKHTFNKGDCIDGNDKCDDTPSQCDPTSGCPNEIKYQLCGSYCPSYNRIMHMNFMDYTSDECKYMFTPDQTIRIQTAMQYGTFRRTLNNSPACQSPSKPDLTIINQNISPSNIVAGTSATFSFVEKNGGGASAGANYVSFHLSSNDVLTPGSNGDRWIGEYYVNQTIAANSQTATLSKSITIPADVPTGTYYVFFSADGTGSVNESNDFNNFATKIINVTNNSGGGGSSCNPITPTNRTQTAYQNYAVLNWSAVIGVNNYNVRYRAEGSSTWNSTSPTANTTQITGLLCNTNYEWQVSSVCSNGTSSAFSSSNTFTTSSCGTSQNNDNCIYAVSLVSSTNCNPINGTVANATNSNYYIGSCGVPEASANAYDVWYQFVAQASSHTITIDPEGNTNSNEYMDVVVGIYSSCSSYSLLECYDKPSTGIGGGVTSTYTFNGLTPGNTYYVRVYDWMTQQGTPPIYPGFTICVTHQTSSGSNTHDFYVQDISLNAYSFSPGDPLSINVAQYTTNPLSNAVNVNMDYTIRDNNGNLLRRLDTDNSTLGNGTAYNWENLNTTFPSGSYGSSCLICAQSNYDLLATESNTNNNRTCVAVSIGNSNNHDFTFRNTEINRTVFNPGDYMLFKGHQYTNNPYGVSTPVNVEFTLRNTSGIIIQQLNTGTSILGGGNEFDFEHIGMDFPLNIPAGNYQVCAETNYDRLASESITNNNLSCINITANGCPTCTYNLSSNNMAYQSGGGTGNFNIIASNICCNWSATSNASWITINGGDYYGNGTVFYTVEPCNSGTTRTGTITAAGKTFTITQNCTQDCNLSQSFQWGVQAGSSTLSDAAADLAIDANSNLYMTGDIQGSANFGNGIILTTPSTAPDIFVSKHNASGQIQWAQRYGNTTQEEGKAIATDNQGNVYVVGYFSSSITFGSTTLTVNNTNEYAAFIIKLNSNGELQWAKKINNQYYGVANEIKIDNNNNIYVLGDFINYQVGLGNAFFIAKYNTTGTQLTFNTYAWGDLKYTTGLTIDNNNNIIVSGRFMRELTIGNNTLNALTSLDMDGFVSKFDNNGNVQWLKKLTSPIQGTDTYTSVITDNSNNIYALGYADSSVIVDNIILPGNGRGRKLVIAKYSTLGNVIWAKSSLNQYQITTNIAKGSNGDIYFAGYHSGDTLKLDNKAIISNGSNDGFVGRIDTNGVVKWLKTIGGTQADEAFGIAVNSSGDVYVAGDFSGVVNYGPITLTSNGSFDIFLAKFKDCDLPIANITYSGSNSICNGQSKLLSTPFCNTNTYQWYKNGILIPNATTATYNATQSGSYTVKVSAFAGCETTSNSVNITISSPPNPTIIGNTTVCNGQTTLLDAGSGYSTYIWSNGATTRQINVGIGNYWVTVTNANNCSATAFKTVNLLNTPTANITNNNNGNSYNFFSNADGDSISYFWDFGDGTMSTIANPTHTYAGNNSYIVTLTVSNRCGSNTYQKSINLATSISNNTINEIKVYPNPNNGQFLIELNSKIKGNCYLYIFNSLGQEVYQQSFIINTNENKIPIDLLNLSSGSYNIRILINEESYYYKIIKM